MKNKIEFIIFMAMLSLAFIFVSCGPNPVDDLDGVKTTEEIQADLETKFVDAIKEVLFPDSRNVIPETTNTAGLSVSLDNVLEIAGMFADKFIPIKEEALQQGIGEDIIDLALTAAIDSTTNEYAGTADIQNNLYILSKFMEEGFREEFIITGSDKTLYNGWRKLTDGNYQYYIDGKAVTGWKNNIPGWNNWFYFDSEGIMATGWRDDIPGWDAKFYFNSNGTMATGWAQIDGNWYYFASNGTLYVNCTTPDGFVVDADGKWINSEATDTKDTTDTTDTKDTTDTFNGWKNLADGKTQYFENGVAVTGWKNDIPDWNNWFYFDSEGIMATGWRDDIPGWDAKFYFNSNGTMATGWAQIDGNWYYFASNGTLYVNCTTPDGFVVDADGKWINSEATDTKDTTDTTKKTDNIVVESGDALTKDSTVDNTDTTKKIDITVKESDGTLTTIDTKDTADATDTTKKTDTIVVDSGDAPTKDSTVDNTDTTKKTDTIVIDSGDAPTKDNTTDTKDTADTTEKKSGWQEIEGKKYYFNSDGEEHTGWLELEGKKYYFDADGTMHIEWLDLSSSDLLLFKKYYFDSTTGVMVTGRQQIGDKVYIFGDDGIFQMEEVSSGNSGGDNNTPSLPGGWDSPVVYPSAGGTASASAPAGY